MWLLQRMNNKLCPKITHSCKNQTSQIGQLFLLVIEKNNLTISDQCNKQ
jgi:hypothetical protein